jgi:hypothetical protein
MPQLSLSQARVVDPVLSAVAQGFTNAAMVSSVLFPRVGVDLRAGNIISFGREDFMLYGTARAPGENTKRVQFGYTSGTYGLVDYSLEGQLPIENMQESMNGPGIDMAAMTVRKTLNIMELRLEKQAADIARNAAAYAAGNKVTLSGTGQWSDYTGTSNPITVIETGKEAVRASTGRRANTVVMGAAVFRWVKHHPVVRDYCKYTGRDVATADLLAALFDVERVIVGDAIWSNDAGTVFTDVWGKDVVVAYTDTASVADMGAPSYGYTYQLNGYPQVEEAYFERNSKSWIFPVTRAEAPVLASAAAGYLVTNAVA